MNRTGIALLVATLVLGLSLSSGAAPVTTSLTVYNGWNLVGFPTVPLAPAPTDVFSGYTDDGNTGGDAIDGKLYRYNPILRSLLAWDTFTTTWGNILIGDGYWLYKNDAGAETFSYQGVDVSGDHWLSLPRAGWTLIGYPNNTPASVSYEALLVTNGIVTKSMTDAVADGWIADIAYYYSNSLRSLRTAGLPDAFPNKLTIDRNEGYWFFTNQDNLALIVPGT